MHPRCKHRKNLEEATYEFGECPFKGFYGENISLHVIVGKNGSGKSSLLDMVLRLANNLGALIFKHAERNAAADLNYVLGIRADLRYQLGEGDIKKDIRLCCRNRALWMEFDGQALWISDKDILGCQPNEHEEFAECLSRVGGDADKISFAGILTPGRQQEIASLFFYTVATNYSMLGFLSPDYEDEDSLCYQFVAERDSKDDIILGDDGNPKGKYEWVPTHNWINSLFHKNDGYMCPIVLNPYRNDAKFDMENETNLSVQRMTAMFICETDKQPLVSGYKLEGLTYEYKENFMHNFKQARGGKSQKELLAEFLEDAKTDGCYAKRILEGLQCTIVEGQHECLNVLAMYMVQKVLNIANTYPIYIERFGGIGGIDRTFEMFEKDAHYNVAFHLADFVRTHDSHIELKVQQALGFYHWAQENAADFTDLLENFNYEDYKSYRDLPKYDNSQLKECMLTLPPAIFKQKVFLQKKLDDNVWISGIPLWRMSSGERQLIYQMSTIVYHLHNLASVNKPSIRYSNINIILDEIEICYHPDFQRRFIKSLLDILKGQELNKSFGVHILITTHSPFVLSDVMSQQILYIQNGHQLKGEELTDIKTPFAANVNEILKQSFFMEEGFVGSFAAEKVNSLLDYLTDAQNAKQWTEDETDQLISAIGDPLVVFQLKKLIARHKIRNGHSYREWLESELSKIQ